MNPPIIVPAMSPTTVTMDYATLPTTLPLVERGARISLTKYRIVDQPEDVGQIRLGIGEIQRTCPLSRNELEIAGYEAIRRLTARGIPLLDVWAIDALRKIKTEIPDAWRSGLTFFAGKMLEDKYGDHFVPCFSWNGAYWAIYLRCLRLSFSHAGFFAHLPIPA
jgi:hypothetical protein